MSGIINISTSGNNTVVAGVAGETITVYGMFFQCGAATTVTFYNGTTAITGPMAFTSGGGLNVFFGDSTPIFTLSPGNSFIINVSGLLPQVGGFMYYTQG